LAPKFSIPGLIFITSQARQIKSITKKFYTNIKWNLKNAQQAEVKELLDLQWLGFERKVAKKVWLGSLKQETGGLNRRSYKI
jgi:hypothetical protein